MFQFSTYFPGYFDGQYWLWWVFLALGKLREGMVEWPGAINLCKKVLS